MTDYETIEETITTRNRSCKTPLKHISKKQMFKKEKLKQYNEKNKLIHTKIDLRRMQKQKDMEPIINPKIDYSDFWDNSFDEEDYHYCHCYSCGTTFEEYMEQTKYLRILEDRSDSQDIKLFLRD
jgi:hypothetical protein